MTVAGLSVGGVRYWLNRPLVAAEYDYPLIAAPLVLQWVPGHLTPA